MIQHKYKNSTRPIFYKSSSTSSTEVDAKSRIVSGYLAAFGNKDDDGDVIIKGAFAKSLNERGVNSQTNRKIAFLYQHDMKRPIGHFKVLKEDDYGLYYEAYVDDIPLGNDVLKQMESGTLNQHSVGFRYVWDKTERDEDNDAFILKEVNLFEGSVVTQGANENTPFTGMKAANLDAQTLQLTKETENILKTLSPEDGYTIRQLISKHIALTEVEPTKSLHAISEPFDVSEAIKKVQFNF